MIKNKGGDIRNITKYISNCMIHNDDGSGYMFSREGKVYIRKGFWKAKDIVKAINQDNIQDHEVLVFHARYATHGARNVMNCHPFPVTRNHNLFKRDELICDKAMAHNGIIDVPLEHKELSDTANFVVSILSDNTILNNIGKSAGVDYMLDKIIGWSKIAVLHGTGKLQVIGSGWQFIDPEDTTIMASNDGWRPYTGFKNWYKPTVTTEEYLADELDERTQTKFCYECNHFEDCENGTGYCYNSNEVVKDYDICSSFDKGLDKYDDVETLTLTINEEKDGRDCAHCLWNEEGVCTDMASVRQQGCIEEFVPIEIVKEV